MSDFVVISDDMVQFDPAAGNAIVVPVPAKIKGTSKAKHGKKKVCLEGDESSVKAENCVYIAPPYTIPGMGSFLIDSLESDQLSEKTKFNGKKVILKGKSFKAKFKVETKAMLPPPISTPDQMSEYSGGTGKFITKNTNWKTT
ncbi:MAG: hypothetical protein HN417_08790 [Desulfobacula sp.]|jgi:hypothetical protein|nr:hypothetical protein [Desulfobacula sp.]